MPATPTTAPSGPVTRAADWRWAMSTASANRSTVSVAGTRTGAGPITSRTRRPSSAERVSSRSRSAAAVPVMNRPMTIVHRPPRSAPITSSSTPNPIRPKPMIRPRRAASSDARSRSRPKRQAIARTIRPPSSGAPGSRLNTASTRFTRASHAAASATSATPDPAAPAATSDSAAPAATPEPATAGSAHAARPNIPPSTRLTTGPDPAMRSSCPGVGASPSSLATPPSSHSVMPATRTPARWAKTACASSCASSEPKNRRATLMPAAQ